MTPIHKLLKQPNALPSAPKVVRKLIETFDQEEVDMLKVAEYIEADPVLTAKLLKLANSAFFGLMRSVSDARGAINVLGLIKVRALVIAAALDDSFHAVGGVNLNQFWRYSLNTANLSRYLALPIRLDESASFTAGLVHAIGELVMHVAMPEPMLELNRSIPLLDLKRPVPNGGCSAIRTPRWGPPWPGSGSSPETWWMRSSIRSPHSTTMSMSRLPA